MALLLEVQVTVILVALLGETVAVSRSELPTARAMLVLFSVTLVTGTVPYTFTAPYAGDASHDPASASCTVETKAVIILPDPPAGDSDKQFKLVMESGISDVPAGLKNIITGRLSKIGGCEHMHHREVVAAVGAAGIGQGDGQAPGGEIVCRGRGPGRATVYADQQKAVIILPDPPAGDSDKQFKLVMESGISDVPAGLKNIESRAGRSGSASPSRRLSGIQRKGSGSVWMRPYQR